MKKQCKLFLTVLSSSVLFGVLINANISTNYKADDYVPEQDAYYAGEIEKKGLLKLEKHVVPTDDKYDKQKTRSSGSGLIGDIESVWSSYTGKGTTIAVIDDGFDCNHPEFIRADGTSAILSTSRYYYSSNTYPYSTYYKEYATDPSCIEESWNGSSWNTHGTNTSTTAAAPMNNGGGVGIAPEADILALKIDMTFGAIDYAIDYAISQKVDVINMSLGAYAESFTSGMGEAKTGSAYVASYLEEVCQSAYEEGVIVIASAGNDATYHKTYPACNSHVISVGAIGDYDNKGNVDQLAEFTNYVDSSQTGEINVDILSPGYVYTAKKGGTSTAVEHTYGDTQGTSFSGPIVAGAACLWKQKYPDGTPDQFLAQLQSSADGIGFYEDKNIGVYSWTGGKFPDVGPSNIENGRLNVANLLEIDEPFVSVKQDEINLAKGEKKQVSLGTYNGNITYSSNNEAIATVDDDGVITGVSSGEATITVTATKNDKTATATISVTISNDIATTSLTFNPNTIALNVGETYDSKSTIVVTPNDATRLFLFESEDEGVATVDEESGLVTALFAGTATINVIPVYGEGFDSLTVTVKGEETQKGTISFGSATGRVNINSASVSASDSLKNSWSITTTGTTSFTPDASYSQIGSSKNPASSITFSLTLSKNVKFSAICAKFGGNNATAGNISIKVGDVLIGSGKLSGNSDVTVNSESSASGNSLVISISSISKGVKAYSIDYSIGPAAIVSEVTVSPSTLDLDFSGTTSSTLTAIVSGSGGPDKNVTWSSLDETVASVDSSGVVTAVGGGQTTIVATSTYDTSKKGYCEVNVNDDLVGLSVNDNVYYRPGDRITKDDIEVVLTYASGKKERTYDFTFDDDQYQFTYADIAGGDQITTKEFCINLLEMEISFETFSLRDEYIDVEKIDKSLSSTHFLASNLSKSSSTKSPTTVTIDGIDFNVTENAYVYTKSSVSYLSFGKGSGYIRNTYPFSSDLSSVSISPLDGSRSDGVLSISKDASNWVNYSDSEIQKGGYRYFKLEFTNTSSSYSNISQIAFATTGLDSPLNVSNYIMYEDVDNQCLTKLDIALERLNNMSSADKTIFNESNNYIIQSARERLQAWAKHEGKIITLIDDSFAVLTANDSTVLNNSSYSANMIIVLTSLISVTTLACIIILKKKNNKII